MTSSQSNLECSVWVHWASPVGVNEPRVIASRVNESVVHSTNGLSVGLIVELRTCRIPRPVPGGYHALHFKSFPVQSDEHLLGLLRYVERNPLSAGLVDRAQLWRWGSLWARTRGTEAIKALLSPWPVERPANWTARVNAPLTKKELDRVRASIERGRPYGGDEWVRETVKDLGMEQTVRPVGRPRKTSPSATEATG
jgi:hypothetical protein